MDLFASQIFFPEFEVPPLRIPESTRSQCNEVAEDDLSLDELYESSRPVSPVPAAKTPEGHKSRNTAMSQHGPVGLECGQWSQPVTARSTADGADNTQNEVAHMTTTLHSCNAMQPNQYKAANSKLTQAPRAQGLRPSIRQKQNPDAGIQKPHHGDITPHVPSDPQTHGARSISQCFHLAHPSTRDQSVRQTQNFEQAESSGSQATLDVISSTDSRASDTTESENDVGAEESGREHVAKANEKREKQEAKERPSSRVQAHLTSPHLGSQHVMYKPYRPHRSESPVPTEPPGPSPHTLDTLENRQLSEVSAQNEGVRMSDHSQAQSVVPTSFSGEVCESCNTCGPRRSYCYVCDSNFCDPCWRKQPLHNKQPKPGSLPHEKTDPSVAKKIEGVLNPQLEEEQREKLHSDDIDTTWFGVMREGELPMFQDYGRYADLVAGVKDLRLGSVSALSVSSDLSEALYPSLVSFVGETGAGKSSLIKLIIDLRSNEDERFETPVVGAAGRHLATSEDVHLYLDPESSDTQEPLLFADCEGLGGGERDPVGAKLRRKFVSSQRNESGGRRKLSSERELAWADTAMKQTREFAVANLYPRLLYTFSDVIVFVVKNPRYVLTTIDLLRVLTYAGS